MVVVVGDMLNWLLLLLWMLKWLLYLERSTNLPYEIGDLFKSRLLACF